MSIREIFYSKVNKTESCWIWTAGTNNRGKYGLFYVPKNGNILAHRMAWILENGPIPPRPNGSAHGWVVMHSCDNPLCVNPAHLRLGTQSENVRHMDAKGRRTPHGLPGESHHQARFTDDDVRRIRSDPRPHAWVAKDFGTSPQEIHYIRTQGWSHIPKPAVQYIDGRTETSRGETNPNARVNADIVRAIRASTAKPGVLAKQYGIKPDTVTKIRRRLSWAHVE